MAVMSFSVDEQTEQEINKLAANERRSKSEIFRDMYKGYRFDRTLSNVRKLGREKFLALGIESIDQAEAFLG